MPNTYAIILILLGLMASVFFYFYMDNFMFVSLIILLFSFLAIQLLFGNYIVIEGSIITVKNLFIPYIQHTYGKDLLIKVSITEDVYYYGRNLKITIHKEGKIKAIHLGYTSTRFKEEIINALGTTVLK